MVWDWELNRNVFEAEASCSESKTTTITASVIGGTGGTITPWGTNGVTTITKGGSQKYTMAPETGKYVSALSINDIAITPRLSYTFTNVTLPQTIEVTYGTLGTPTNLAASCDAEGDQVTLSWTAGTGNTSYRVRMNDLSNDAASCLDGWNCSTPPDRAYYGVTVTSVSYSVTPGQIHGWWIHGDNPTRWGAAVGGNFTCDAPATYAVTYNINGATGTTPVSQTKTHNVNLTLQTNSGFSRTGYTFVGWNTAADGTGTNYDSGDTYIANAAVTLYAKWTYTLPTVDSPTVTTVTPTTAVLGANVTSIGSADLSDRGTCISTANLNSTNWGTCIAHVNSSGGNTTTTGIFTHTTSGLTAGTLYYFRGFARSGFTLDHSQVGWSTVSTFTTPYSIDASVTGGATGGGTISPLGRTLVAPGGNQGYTMTPNSGYTITNVKINDFPIGTPSSYTFNAVTSNQTIEVTYGAITCSGTLPTNTTVCSGDDTGLTAPTSWSRVNSCTANTIKCEYRCTTGFTWNASTSTCDAPAATYTVNYNANGGSGTMAAQTITSGSTANLTANAFTRSGYTFAGWATTAAGAVEYADRVSYTMGSANITLYAKWTAIPTALLTTTKTSLAHLELFSMTATGGNGAQSCQVMQSANGGPTSLFSNLGTSHTWTSQQAHTVGTMTYTLTCYSNADRTGVASLPSSVTLAVAYSIDASVTGGATGGGTISPLGRTLVPPGGNQGYTMTPNAGRYISDLKINGFSLTPTPTDTSYTFNDVRENKTIEVTYGVFAPVTTFQGRTGNNFDGWSAYQTTINLTAADDVTFNWSVTNAVGGSCTGYSTNNYPGWSSSGTGGKLVLEPGNWLQRVSVSQSTRFDLDCWSASGVAAPRQSVQVNIVAPGAPTLSISANPENLPAGGGTSRLTWTTSGATSCWATGDWTGWKTSTGGFEDVAVSNTTTYTLECWNSASVSTGQRSATVTITATPTPATLTVCPTSSTIGVGTTQTFIAWHTPEGTSFSSCTGGPGQLNVTTSSTWSSTDTSKVTVNTSGVATGIAIGSATVQASYSGLNDSVPVTVNCPRTALCGAQDSTVCSGATYTVSDSCGTYTCTGTRSCDYNWIEVAP